MSDYIIVSLFGLGIGLGELVSRYRDAPLRAVATAPALLYMLINALAALGALGVVRVFGVDFGIEAAEAERLRWTQLFVAGFASMALFRSSLFTVRVGDQDIGIGPSSFLQLVLQAADRGVDRVRAEARASEVLKAMDGVSFAKAYAALPVLCLELMQNLPSEDQAALGEEIKKLHEAEIDDGIKTLILGLKLMNLVGQGVLLGAVESIAPRIRAAQHIELSLDTTQPVQPGRVRQLHAQVVDRLDREIARSGLVWSTDNEAVVTVLPNGTLIPRAPGTATVTATLDGVAAHLQIHVPAPEAAEDAAGESVEDTAGETAAEPAAAPPGASGQSVEESLTESDGMPAPPPSPPPAAPPATA